jgi:predicted dehydrogenase
MTTTRPIQIAIAGCGNIAGPYARTLRHFPQLNLVGAADLDPARAQAFAGEFGGKAYGSLDDLLADDGVELVINLTIHHAHAEVITRALNAGKHVFSEKPLTLSYAEARDLVDLAEARGLRLGGAPITYMGEAQQTAWRLIRGGKLGTVRVAYAEVNWGRIESWHPNPVPFYAVGPLFDVGVYPLTLLTAIFGPVRRVTGFGRTLYPDRKTKDGTPFHLDAADFSVALAEHAGGMVTRLTTNFYVGHHTVQKGLEFHGDLASLYLHSWDRFNSQVDVAPFGEAYAPVELIRPPYDGIEWARGVAEMADAIAEGRPHRATGAHAAHVVEILEAVKQSWTEGRPVAVHSDFPPPPPMEWAQG